MSAQARCTRPPLILARADEVIDQAEDRTPHPLKKSHTNLTSVSGACRCGK